MNFFGDSINLLNFIGCCTVFLGVILYKAVLLMEKEEKKAKNAVATEKSLAEQGNDGHDDKERQPLHSKEEQGIEMRRGRSF